MIPPDSPLHHNDPGAETPGRQELPFVSMRLMVMFGLFLLVMAIFAMRIYDLTILQGPQLRDVSDNNFMSERSVLPPRGRIVDRNAQPLAVNQILNDVSMSPFRLTREEITKSLALLAVLLDRPELSGKVDWVRGVSHRWDQRRLVRNLTQQEVLPVYERLFELPGVIITPHFKRHYPAGHVAGLVTGHVSQPRNIEPFLEKGYLRTESVGQLNVEQAFEEDLHGSKGQEIVMRDALGRERSRYESFAARPGHTLTLTLDLELQRLADALLEGWNGAIVAMDPRDGGVLAMAARPTYDPNFPARALSDGKRSSFNKITRGVYAPGSTFKVITAAAGLSQGYSPDEVTDCPGHYRVKGVRKLFYCNWRPGHNDETMYDAIQHSCNVYFYNWAYRMGIEPLVEMASSFGFGQRTGFDGVVATQEKPGVLVQPGLETIYLADRLYMAIGQGRLIGVTPMQMAQAYSAVANGGTLYQPHLLKAVHDAEGSLVRRYEPIERGKLPLSEENLGHIREGLRRVTQVRGGTGSRAGLKPEWNVSGKTGTSETGRKIPNAWFACYAPADDPQITLVILVEDSGHGGDIAAPLARQIMAHFFGEPEEEIVPPPQPEQEETAADE